ncbi:unnamed protein product, partial [Polarella glacialis]
ALALVVGVLHYFEVSGYSRELWTLSVQEQKAVSLKTENAFYYSYYEETVLAPSVGAALGAALRDSRSEAPDTINAIRRFNIYQEIFTGLLYRALVALVGQEQLPDP